MLLDQDSLSYLAYVARWLPSIGQATPSLLEAFRTGGGVSWAAFGADAREAQAIDEVESQFYLQLEVADQPGVLAEIAAQFGEHDVSIKSMQQVGIGAEARLSSSPTGRGKRTCGHRARAAAT